MFYERLKQLAKEKNVSLTNLVKELGMSTGNLSRWKSGIVPKSDTVSALAEYFEVTSDYLLGIDREKINTLQEKALNILDDSDVTLTYDEKWFIRKLRSLDKEGRTMVESTLIAECRRMEAAGKGETVNAG